jgi:SAM-dependent methyltransferase
MKLLGRCIVCGKTDLSQLYPPNFEGDHNEGKYYFLTNRLSTAHGGIWKCSECGFVFTNPQFDEEAYEEIYRSISLEADRSKISDPRFKALRDAVCNYVRTGRLLDLGCGDGAFLNLMGEFHSTGIELRPSPCGKSGNQSVITGDFLQLVRADPDSWKQVFDLVTAWDFFEHVPNITEYPDVVGHVLKNRGWLMCTLPNVASWAARLSGKRWNCFLLEHLWYFSPTTFGRFISRFGFEVEDIKPFPYSVDLATLVKRLNQTYGLPEFSLGPIADITLDLPIGLMFAACRKAS